jgi:hypothetical protein
MDATTADQSLDSVPNSKFVRLFNTLRTTFGFDKVTGKFMILEPPFDLSFVEEIAAGGAGTSNRRH